jgi:anaphase-promoting complex subunit 6
VRIALFQSKLLISTLINDIQSEPSDDSVYKALESDVSIQAATAHRLYNKGNISEAYNITSAILAEYGYYEDCILVHIACLVALRKHNALFALSHKLVDTMKENHITWYSVGCYYYMVELYATAKKFLEKSTTINAGFGEGWVSFSNCQLAIILDRIRTRLVLF